MRKCSIIYLGFFPYNLLFVFIFSTGELSKDTTLCSETSESKEASTLKEAQAASGASGASEAGEPEDDTGAEPSKYCVKPYRPASATRTHYMVVVNGERTFEFDLGTLMI